MSIPAQFQIGLELTNIVNPLSQALSALGSLALVDAIKKAGSDAITEIKLASLIGRHRVDEVIKWHFREKVANSDRSVISRYVDIVLESGAGPTVQEALKNPALFSMVIQLSALAFAHEDESLAYGIVEAIENIVKESGSELEIVPDYVSLLGTVRACRQQTATFRWAPIFEDVEWRLGKLNRRGSPTDFEADDDVGIDQDGVVVQIPYWNSRALPFPVLQSLTMWLRTLQNFPEHRLLHIRCDRGISTIVVWCHHILGITVSVNIQHTEITFGNGYPNVLIEACDSGHTSASLMDPADQSEPLFSLRNDENSPGLAYERRVEAYGCGLKVLKDALLSPEDINNCICEAISVSHSTLEKMGEYRRQDRIIRAARFLFAMEEVPVDTVEKLSNSAPRTDPANKGDINFLSALLTALSGIEEDDLENCRQLPLSLSEMDNICRERKHWSNELSVYRWHMSPSATFELLSRLILGHAYAKEYVESAILISAWGWSVFLECFNTQDPADMPTKKVRVLLGVPSRRGLRRSRLIDGPTVSETSGLSAKIECHHATFEMRMGISTARKGPLLVGHRSDAFQITQTFVWDRFESAEYRHIFGLRKMHDMIAEISLLDSCSCESKESPTDCIAWMEENLCLNIEKLVTNCPRPFRQRYTLKWPNRQDTKDISEERVFEILQKEELSEEARKPMDTGMRKQTRSRRVLFYVTSNPQARWLQLEALLHSREKQVPSYTVFIRGRDTCFRCATSVATLNNANAVVLL